jgi:antitoxin (DNA-binding transcriptional repressor) of toxin-antitoxin stability system
MITMTATEAGRSFSAVLDLASEGETISITRGGELVATIVPPVRSNGAAIVAAYADHRPDPAFADALETAHRDLNIPEEVRDPWAEG